MARTRRAPEQRVVLAEVARVAGTSESTASRALKDDPRIGETTRAAVRAAAASLGYVPNAAARSLRAKRTHILGLLLDDLADPTHGEVAAGFEAAAAAEGFVVFIMTGFHDEGRERRALRTFIEHRADGICLESCISDPAEVFRDLPAERVVFVQPDFVRMADGAEPPARGSIRSDDHAGVTALVRHLVEQGYRRIAYVGAGATASDLRRRSAATEALADHGMKPVRIHDAGRSGWGDPAAIARDIADDPPEAVICYDDKLALALVDALRDVGLETPADIAVVGFDGIPLAFRARPRLTTVSVPSSDIGRRAAEMLIAAARDRRMRRSEILPVELVVGESTPRREAGPSTDRVSQAAGRAMVRGS
jgi:LacI family transcriptional regulator